MLGEHAYSPRLLLKVWLYAATQGVYSGREIARRLQRDLAFRYLAGDGPVPDFRTVNGFRLRHRLRASSGYPAMWKRGST